MAKPKKIPLLPNALTEKTSAPVVEPPQIRWNLLLQVGAILFIAWIFAFLLKPYIGYWGLVVVGTITVLVAAIGVYAYLLFQKQKAMLQLLKQAATNEEGRKAALEQLSKESSGDALKTLARAQLIAKENPEEAIALLESIPIGTADPLIRDDIRANLVLLYLATQRLKEARIVANEIQPDQAPTAKQKAMYAAVVAETWARSGKAKEAKTLIDSIDIDSPEVAELVPLIARAQAFVYVGTKNRGLAKKAMERLLAIDPNLLAPFLTLQVRSLADRELQQVAREALAQAHFRTKAKIRTQRK
ncbi:MAG: hypothetical protein RMJ84_01840 [Sandaracinaceae bacterium]|nr:hypothetical protein [Sandaracinaceae bacterium]